MRILPCLRSAGRTKRGLYRSPIRSRHRHRHRCRNRIFFPLFPSFLPATRRREIFRQENLATFVALGLAEKVGNVPGIRLQAEDVLRTSRRGQHHGRFVSGFSKTIARFESRLGVSFPPLQNSPAVSLENLGEDLKNRNISLLFKALDSFSAGPTSCEAPQRPSKTSCQKLPVSVPRGISVQPKKPRQPRRPLIPPFLIEYWIFVIGYSPLFSIAIAIVIAIVIGLSSPLSLSFFNGHWLFVIGYSRLFPSSPYTFYMSYMVEWISLSSFLHHLDIGHWLFIIGYSLPLSPHRPPPYVLTVLPAKKNAPVPIWGRGR